jgi:hypothetical protein
MPDLDAEHCRIARDLARLNGRTVISAGVEWRVYELPPGVYDRRGSPSLVFESSDAFRRVRDFPTNWRALDDERLYAVSQNI